MNSDKSDRFLILTLFFFSGLSALVYEVAWSRSLLVIFGNTVSATSIVLAAYMAGLAAGSYFIGRWIDKKKQLLLYYGFFEIAIGIAAFLLPWGFTAVEEIYFFFSRSLSQFGLIFIIIRFILIFLILMIPTTLMGATLPILSKYFVGRYRLIGHEIGSLYAINTAGAVAGTLISGFYLISVLGLRFSVYVGVLINVLVGLIAIYLNVLEKQKPMIGEEGTDTEKSIPKEQSKVKPYPAKLKKFAVLIFAFSGFAALSYEVLWTRLLVYFLGNSVYAFSTMLATFLTGIALGSWIYSRWIDKIPKLIYALGITQLAIAIAVFLSVPIISSLFYWLGNIWEAFKDSHWANPLWLKFFKSFIVMLPATIFMGASFPVVARIYTEKSQTGKGIGLVYAYNTVGAILGSLVTGFILIPFLGIQISLLMIAVLQSIFAFLLIMKEPELKKNRLVAYVAVAILIGTVVIGIKFGEFRVYRQMIDYTGELYYKEGKAATVRVYEDSEELRHVSINGWPVAGTGNEYNMGYPECQIFLGQLPMLLHPNPQNVLLVGFGVGGASYATWTHHVEEIDCIELIDEIMETAPFFVSENNEVYSKENYRYKIDDGRNFLNTTNKKYDVIIIDSIDPKHDGNGNLYTREFFAMSKKRLNEQGLFCLWLPYFQLTPTLMDALLNSFIREFPQGQAWYTPLKSYVLLVGGRSEIQIHFNNIEKRMQTRLIKENLHRIFVDNVYDFVSNFALGPAEIKAMIIDSTVENTYDYPIIEFFGFHWRGSQNKYENLNRVYNHQANILPYLKDISEGRTQAIKDSLALYQNCALLLTQARIAGIIQDVVSKKKFLIQAYDQFPQNRAVKFLLGISEFQKNEINKGRSLISMASIYMEDKKWLSAERALKEAETFFPGERRILQQLALVYFKMANYQESQKYYKKILSVGSPQSIDYFNMAMVYDVQQDLEKAALYYRKTLDLDPKNQSATIGLQLSQARVMLGNDPENPELRLRLAKILFSLKRFKEVISLFPFKQTSTVPTNIAAILAASYENIGDLEKALHYYKLLLNLHADDARLHEKIESLSEKIRY